MLSRTIRHAFDPSRAAGLFVLFALGLGTPPAQAQAPLSAADAEEMRYVDGLNRLGLPQYAELVLATLGSGPEVKARRLESSLARGEFDKVKAIIDAETDQNSLGTWMMRRSLAEASFTWGKYPEARAIYDAFFAKYKDNVPEDLKDFFYETANGYAHMLLMMNDPQAAIEAYHMGIKANPPRDVKRQFQGGLADILMDQADKSTGTEQQKYIDEADKIADDLLWLQDLWFGRAIVIKAHVLMLKGDVDGAMKLVDEYRDDLVGLDKALAEQSTPDEDFTRLSPMAEARYLVGVILLDEAKRILAANGDRKRVEELLAGKTEQKGGLKPKEIPGAIQHFGNVFIKYPNTQWAGDASAKFYETREILVKQLGKQVKFEPTAEQKRKVEAEQYKAGKSLLNQQKYAEAADQYQSMLRASPEGEFALEALADLGTCYVELKDDIYADTVILYIAERFNKNPRMSKRAGDLVLGFGNMYMQLKQPEHKDAIYEIFFDNFKTHALTAQLLNSFGDRRLAATNYPAAFDYYQRVAREYTNSPLSFTALSKMAVCFERQGEPTNALRTLDVYVSRATNRNARLNHELIRVLYRQGTIYREQGLASYPAAVRRYNDIEQRLTTNRVAYQSTSEEAQQNQDLLEASMYFKAACFARAVPPAGKPENVYKEMALKLFLKLADTYPKSRLAPTALSQAGTLWTVLGNAEQAQTVFTRLKTQYPESREAKNVDYQLASNLLKLGKRKEAVPIFKQMFSGEGQYTPAQILSAGVELFQSKEYEIAVEAFDQVLAKAAQEDRGLIEPALAYKGRAQVELGRHADGMATLDTLFAQYPKTPFTVPASYAMSKACAELGSQEPDATKRVEMFNKSVTALKTVVQRDAANPALTDAMKTARRGEATIQVGQIYELKAQAETAHGTPEKAAEFRDQAIANYQILTLIEDPMDPNMRPHLDEAYHRSLALYLEAQRWKDLAADAGAYLQAFPNGKYVLDIRQWRSTAMAHVAAEGGTVEEAPEAGAVAPMESNAPAESGAAQAPAAAEGVTPPNS